MLYYLNRIKVPALAETGVKMLCLGNLILSIQKPRTNSKKKIIYFYCVI